ITREGKYQHRGDLVHVEHGNMPAWAKEEPQHFWQAADKFERKNGSAYREFEIALPRELNNEQQIGLVREFVSRELGERHAYTLAIHNPTASIDGGEKELSKAIETMMESVTEFKSVSENVSQQVRQSVSREIQQMNVGQLLGDQTAATFKSIEKTASLIKQQADVINQETFSARETLLHEYRQLKNRFWWFIGAGVIFAAGLTVFNSWYFNHQLEVLKANQNVIYRDQLHLKQQIEKIVDKPKSLNNTSKKQDVF
ncbi:MobA/MobL family protein, partial [Providencia rettgeri]|uniref:MobA/MobL family protein n=1 Tax=Providencia rettgeri TaxID=587 RepID=UPI0030189A21